MSNEQGRETMLDRAIDDVVRDMMHVDPRPGLRLRVLHRLSRRPQHRGWVGFGALASAAVLVLIFATTLGRNAELQPASPGQAAVEPSPMAGTTRPASEPATSAPQNAPAAAVETARRGEPSPESIFGPRNQQVRGASTPSVNTDPLGPVGPARSLQTSPQASAPKVDASKETTVRPNAQLANLKLDITINDERDGVSTPKTVTIVTADRQRGRVRASAPHAVLNVDAQPEILPDGRIRVYMTVSYQAVQQPGERSRPASLEKSITAILDEGKTLNVSQSTDPASTRTVKVDIKATLLK